MVSVWVYPIVNQKGGHEMTPSDISIITLDRLSALPHGNMLSTWNCRDEQEAKEWAAKFGADTVYLFRQSNGTLTTWIFPKKEGDNDSI